MAKSVGQRVPEKGFDDGRHRVWGRNPSCNMPSGFFRDIATQQAEVLRTEALQFAGNEFDGLLANGQMLLSPACAVWAISMRDPNKRFLSHFDVIKCPGTFQNALGTYRNVITHVTLRRAPRGRPGLSPDVSLGASGRTAE